MGLPTTTDAPLEEKPSLLQAYRRKAAPGLWVGPTLAVLLVGREFELNEDRPQNCLTIPNQYMPRVCNQAGRSSPHEFERLVAPQRTKRR
jgi:hypothetical protein